MADVIVTQEDRASAWEHRPSCYKVDNYTDWMDGRYDMAAPIIGTFARHRQQAMIEGARVALEAAAEKADDLNTDALMDWVTSGGDDYGNGVCDASSHITDAITSLSPADIIRRHLEGEG